MLQMHYDTRKLFIYSNNKNRLKENYSSTMLKLFINSGHYYEFIDTWIIGMDNPLFLDSIHAIHQSL